ncbi:MAG: acyltransferase [Paenibacillus sp.]|uniref:acyltransferase family protein n=1 Tax=Paenibacillus sp. GCM10012303 TaxID=3317340 RepID=UPI0029EA2388|nr:acyltransferase [Paenibacillus sp.]
MIKEQGEGKSRYMPGLDGLRAISVLAVIAYHMNVSWAPGGLLGVAVFFTLSGYLITDQLVAQWQTTKQIDFAGFWMRRIRRLMPAMFVMLAVVGAWLLLFDRERLASLQGDFVSVALYFNNWWLIFHQVSYFESFGPPSPLGHLWSIAIEEQFYLIWPILLLALLRVTKQRGKLMMFILLGAAASAIAMAMIYVPGSDPSRVYYGTDTRAFALLIGAALAVAWPSRSLSAAVSNKSRLVLDILGGAGLLAIVWLVWKTNEYDSLLYNGGLALFSVLTAVVTAVLAHPASRVAKVMGSKPLRWIGVRSYSLYLWHFPVMILMSPSGSADDAHAGRAIVQIALSLLLAALSWTYIEEPIRRGSRTPSRGEKQGWSPFHYRNKRAVSTFALMLFLISGYSSLNADKPADPSPAIIETSPNGQEDTIVPDTDPGIPAIVIPEAPIPMEPQPKSEESSEPATNARITAIGDSVLLDAAPHLEKLLPGIVIDGKVGRQMYQALDVVDMLKAEGKLGDRVVIELGSNGAFSSKQLRELLSSLQDARKIVLINTRVPRKWQDTVNSTLQEVADEYSNTEIMDWYSASKEKQSYFADDGVHLKREGAESYASLLSKTLQGG